MTTNKRKKESRRLEIHEVIVNNRVKPLKRPIMVSVERGRDKTYILEDREFGLFACHKNIEKAISNIKKDFGTLWIEYVNENEGKLGVEAKHLRQKLIERIDEGQVRK